MAPDAIAHMEGGDVHERAELKSVHTPIPRNPEELRALPNIDRVTAIR